MIISQIYSQQDWSYITNCHDSNNNCYYEDNAAKTNRLSFAPTLPPGNKSLIDYNDFFVSKSLATMPIQVQK
jgi:hypothetical protein